MHALLFLHIPKTAGTALVRAIEPLFEPEERLRLYNRTDIQTVPPKQFPSLSLERRQRLKFVAGHFRYGLHELLPQPARYITVLRDPVERIRSLYDHFRVKPQPGEADWHNWITREQADLRRFFLEKPSRQMDNFMVRMLSGQDAPFGGCTPAMLEHAKRHLETFPVVLFQDDMQTGLTALSNLLGKPIRPLRNVNVSPHEAATPDETRSLIAARNALDMELYGWATERYRA